MTSLRGSFMRARRATGRLCRQLYDLMAAQMLASMLRILKRRALAEEALQDVFVSIWQRAAQFESGRGPARIWLLAIARHRAIDVLRSERVDLYREADVEQMPHAAPWKASGTGRARAARPRRSRAASKSSAASSAAASSSPSSMAIRTPTLRA
jgi:DNA-directed RNA polymerase specialized sigma24 family protein